jgi:phosphoribosylformylglycinamidine cyclo-ligase
MSDKITYKDAGVDVDLAESVLQSVGNKIRSTFTPGVIGNLGGFAATFRPEWRKFNDPVLVSTTDGVGTKLKIAFMMGRHDTVGVDLVAMSVNDIVVTGAQPLFFLDYFATGKIKTETFETVVSGITKGCKMAGCALIGGETAEMPDFYSEGEYDLAGFCVGILDQTAIIDGSRVVDGDSVIGIGSSGLHSNGFSLVRKVLLDKEKYSLDQKFPELQSTLGEELLKPTSIYVKPILSLMNNISIKSIAHITGGGFYGNIPRIIPKNIQVIINSSTWETPPIFRILKRASLLDNREMFETFNMGVGMILIVHESEADKAIHYLRESGLPAWRMGNTRVRSNDSEDQVIIN